MNQRVLRRRRGGSLLAFESSLIQFVKTKNPALVSRSLRPEGTRRRRRKVPVAAIAEFKKSWA